MPQTDIGWTFPRIGWMWLIRPSGMPPGMPIRPPGIRALFKALGLPIAWFEAEIAAHPDQSPELARDAELLRSVPGIGQVTSANLMARLPELGQLDRRAAI